jgi:hypothetical protein
MDEVWDGQAAVGVHGRGDLIQAKLVGAAEVTAVEEGEEQEEDDSQTPSDTAICHARV